MFFDSSTGLALSLYFLLPSCLAFPLTSRTDSRSKGSHFVIPASTAARVSSNTHAQQSRTISQHLTRSTSLGETVPDNVQLALNPETQRDLDDLDSRRKGIIVDSVIDGKSVAAWTTALGPNGRWPDVDYTAGCAAQPASWPAYHHWKRLVTLAAVYAGPVPGFNRQYKNADLLSAINRAMDYWFQNDFTNSACLDSGGTDRCPCGTPGLWNKNWFSSIILIPKLVAQSCLLLSASLSAKQASICTRFSLRAYGSFYRSVVGLGRLTGANLLDVASIGVDEGIRSKNLTLLQDAYQRMHVELSHVKFGTQDGIHFDGGFEQHSGILYSGNYGKDYLNDVLAMEIPAAGTQFQAGRNSMKNIASLIEADTWMMIYNTVTDVIHWDLAVIGRFISYPVSDNMASAKLNTNITQLSRLGHLWGKPQIYEITDRLSTPRRDSNVGNVRGIRLFKDNDYLVQRGQGYVTTLKMYSARTKGAECINGENVLGFHLSDGVLRTYIKGNEYEDIAASMDWNLLPGITVDYGATPLSCEKSGYTGVEAFVGSAGDGTIATAAMRYENPLTHTFNFQKSWFFLEKDIQLVLVSSISSSSAAPVYSVLDQRLRDGDIIVDDLNTTGGHFNNATSLWHGSVGYMFNPPTNVVVTAEARSGLWSSISPSLHETKPLDLFTAYIDQGTSSLSYRIYPATTKSEFLSKKSLHNIAILRNDRNVSAIYDDAHQTVSAVFWDAQGGTVDIPNPGHSNAPFQLTANVAAIVIYRLDSNRLIVSDPTQKLKNVGVSFITTGSGKTPWGDANNTTVTTKFRPSGEGTDAGDEQSTLSEDLNVPPTSSSVSPTPSQTAQTSVANLQVQPLIPGGGLIALTLVYSWTLTIL